MCRKKKVGTGCFVPEINYETANSLVRKQDDTAGKKGRNETLHKYSDRMWELSQDLVLLHAIQNAIVDVKVNEGKLNFRDRMSCIAQHFAAMSVITFMNIF